MKRHRNISPSIQLYCGRLWCRDATNTFNLNFAYRFDGIIVDFVARQRCRHHHHKYTFILLTRENSYLHKLSLFINRLGKAFQNKHIHFRLFALLPPLFFHVENCSPSYSSFQGPIILSMSLFLSPSHVQSTLAFVVSFFFSLGK